MSLLDPLAPYVLYIKLAAVAVALLSVIGVCWYIKSVFNDRERLVADNAKIQFELTSEKQKVIVAMEQLKIWQDTVEKMNRAIKSIKIEANSYVEQTLKETKPVIPAGGSVPLLLSGNTAAATMPRFTAFSTARTGSATPAGGSVPVR